MDISKTDWVTFDEAPVAHAFADGASLCGRFDADGITDVAAVDRNAPETRLCVQCDSKFVRAIIRQEREAHTENHVARFTAAA